MNRLMLLFLLFIAAQGVMAQANFDEAIQQGDAAFRRGQFKTALNKYLAAEAFDPSRRDLVEKKIDIVFNKINYLLQDADRRRESQKNKNLESLTEKESKPQAELVQKGAIIDFRDTMVAFSLSNKWVSIRNKKDLQHEIDSLEQELKSAHQLVGLVEEKQRHTEQQYQLVLHKPLQFIRIVKEENGKSVDYFADAQGNTFRIAYDVDKLNADVTALDISYAPAPKKISQPNTPKENPVNKAPEKYKSFPAALFVNPQLRILLANNHSLQQFNGSLERWKNLIALELDRNDFENIPSQIGLLTNLAILRMRDNSINKVSPEIGNLKNLAVLDLSYNALRELPAAIGNLGSMMALNLGENKLNALPSNFGNLTRLAELNLNGNALTELPQSIGNLKSLKRLTISDNQLLALPAQIGELQELTELDASYNQLTKLPETLGKLQKLESLDLSGNQLSAIPASLMNLPYLQKLDLRNNNIESLPENLEGWSRLKELDLSGNSINRTDLKRLKAALPKVNLEL